MITLKDIIGNIKKGQSALNVRVILNNLEKTYQQLIRDIKITGCTTTGTDSAIVYMTMPSATVNGISYDVVIWVDTQTKMKLTTPLKVYTNSPSFAYNFTYVFYRKGSLLFPEKYTDAFKSTPPKMRNPFMSVGFDRHVFAGIRYISDYKLPRIISKYDNVTPRVKSFQQKMNEIGAQKLENEKQQSRIRR